MNNRQSYQGVSAELHKSPSIDGGIHWHTQENSHDRRRLCRRYARKSSAATRCARAGGAARRTDISDAAKRDPRALWPSTYQRARTDYETMVPFQALLMVGHTVHAVCPDKTEGQKIRSAYRRRRRGVAAP